MVDKFQIWFICLHGFLSVRWHDDEHPTLILAKFCNKKFGNPLISMLRDLPGLFFNSPLVTIMDPQKSPVVVVGQFSVSFQCFENFAFDFHVAVWRIVRGVCLSVFISRLGAAFEEFAAGFYIAVCRSVWVLFFGFHIALWRSVRGVYFWFPYSDLADYLRILALVFISWFGGVFEEFAFGFHVSIWRSI
jgi:hypothetical protein